MKRLVLAALALALVVPAFAVPALADPTDPKAPAAAPIPAGAHRVKNPGVYVVPATTIYGRPNKPMVNVEVRSPSAAEAAGAAHDRLRAATLARTEPAAP
jgi:hypothetical protein